MFIFIISVLILLVLSFLLYSKWNHFQSKKCYAQRNVKYVQFGNIFLDAFKSKQRPELKRDQFVRDVGKVFGFDMMGARNIMVAEPELIQTIMVKEFTNFADRRKFKMLNTDPIFGGQLLGAEGEQWKRLRAIITPTFSAAKVRKMKLCVDDTVKNLVKNLDDSVEKSSIQNMKPFYSAFTMDTIIRIAFGIQVDSLVDPDNPLASNAKRIFSQDLNLRAILTFALTIMFPRLATALKMRISDGAELQFFYKLSLEIVKKKRAEMKADSSLDKGSNFIELMLEAEEAQNRAALEDKEQSGKLIKYMTNDEIVAQCVLFFIVGFDTTASTLTLASYFLALNPEVQEKLYQEIEDTLTKLEQESDKPEVNLSPELVTFEALNRFEYLSAVISETLRICPPGLIAERSASKDNDLETSDGKHRIHVKKDDVIAIPIYSVHRDPDQFPDPERFDPERFLGEPSFHKYSYIPFGSGPRNCVARSLALMELKMALMNVVWRYKLSVCEKTTIPVEFYNQFNVLIPRDVHLKLEKRSNE